MKKEKRVKNKMSVESILVAADFYGLTEKDLDNKEKMDGACIRLQADLVLNRMGKLSVGSYPFTTARRK
ncbi:MAG: hypothetical protein WCK61_01260 [Candidatus Omnitrophota bacterium]